MNSTTKLLSEVAIMASGGTPNRKNKDYWNGNIPWVTTSEVSQYEYILDTKEKITELGLQNSSAKLFPEGSILLALYGQGKTRGKVALLGIPATTNQACLAIQPDNTLLKTKYLYYYLENSYEKLRRMANSGGQDNLSMAILKDFPINFPDLSTQEYRVNLFDKLSLKIQLQKEKIDLLKEQKKGYMQKIFCQELKFKDENGQDFPGWTKVKLGKLTKKTGQKNSKGIKYPVAAISNKKGFTLEDERNNSNADVDIKSYKLVNFNEFAYNPSRINVGSFGFQNVADVAIVSSLYVIFETLSELENAFLKMYMHSIYFNQQVKKNTEGSVREYLFYENFSNIKIPLPCIKEQQKISSFMDTFDSKINLAEQKLEQLMEQKQAFMQQMFI